MENKVSITAHGEAGELSDLERGDAAPSAFGMAAMGAFSLPGPAAPRGDAPAEPIASVPVEFAGRTLLLDPTGALYWPSRQMLVVSDLHLETGSSYARTGQMLPPYDTALTLARLEEAVARYRPQRIVSLGDTFHDPFGVERLGEDARGRLAVLGRDAELVFVTGNHEGDSAGALGGTVVDAWGEDGIVFRHIPTEGALDAPEVAGHLHPAARVVLRGRALRRRCFIGCDRRLVMPAFGSYTGGLNVSDAAFSALWPQPPAPRLHLIGRSRVYSVAARA